MSKEVTTKSQSVTSSQLSSDPFEAMFSPQRSAAFAFQDDSFEHFERLNRSSNIVIRKLEAGEDNDVLTPPGGQSGNYESSGRARHGLYHPAGIVQSNSDKDLLAQYYRTEGKTVYSESNPDHAKDQNWNQFNLLPTSSNTVRSRQYEPDFF